MMKYDIVRPKSHQTRTSRSEPCSRNPAHRRTYRQLSEISSCDRFALAYNFHPVELLLSGSECVLPTVIVPPAVSCIRPSVAVDSERSAARVWNTLDWTRPQ